MDSRGFHSIPVASSEVLPSLKVGVSHSHVFTLGSIQIIFKALVYHGNCNSISIILVYSVGSSSG